MVPRLNVSIRTSEGTIWVVYLNTFSLKRIHSTFRTQITEYLATGSLGFDAASWVANKKFDIVEAIFFAAATRRD